MISIIAEINKILLQLKKYNVINALDLGCGKGRISIKLAENGIKVLGVDTKECPTKHENFRFIKEGIENFRFDEKYDLIVCSLLLHFFKRGLAVSFINKIQQSTSIGGLNFFILMSDKDDLYENKPGNFYPNFESLKEIYSGWEVLTEAQDYTETEKHDNMGEHRHNLIFALFRKKD